jgi:membrane protein implicated in regulation of membrane protease activity
MALLVGGTLALIFLDLPWSAIVIALLAGVEVFEFRIWRWAMRQRPVGGIEGLVGQWGTLIEDDRVRIQGTTYAARSTGAAVGEDVIVDGVDGMTLVVRKSDRPRYEVPAE